MATAGALGVPVVATLRGAGWVTPAHEIAPGDVAALGAALNMNMTRDGALAAGAEAGLPRVDARAAHERLRQALRAAVAG